MNRVISAPRSLSVLGVVAVIAAFVLALPGMAFALDTFDTAPTLSPTQAPNAWYPDRYPPAAFEKAAFDGGNRLRIGVSSADSAANRPASYSGGFYNTQGRKFDLAPGSKVVSGDLYVGPEWETSSRRSDLWVTAVDAGGASTGFPIIGFTNGVGFRVWDNLGWHTVGFPAGFTYGRWHNLKIQLDPTAVTYWVDGAVIYTSDFAADPEMAACVGFSNVIMQAYNFGDTYDAYWDNLSPVTPTPAPPAVVSTPASSSWSIALLGCFGAALMAVLRKKGPVPTV